ncbi:UNVERIFIED_CONTAM: hypothetical protein FKN15_026276 [Acipenser sinensis]
MIPEQQSHVVATIENIPAESITASPTVLQRIRNIFNRLSAIKAYGKPGMSPTAIQLEQGCCQPGPAAFTCFVSVILFQMFLMHLGLLIFFYQVYYRTVAGNDMAFHPCTNQNKPIWLNELSKYFRQQY